MLRTNDPELDRERATGIADRALYAAKDRQRGSAVLHRDGRETWLSLASSGPVRPLVRAA